MTKGKGYLLPSGDASEDELACCLVFYPSRDEYRRALMGSLDYLATWIAWERDSEKRGQDAAASWKMANIQTWECCNMGYCEDLLTTLESLLAATQALECCGEQDITDGEQFTDDVVDGVGDVPQNIIDAGYAEDAEDWTGFASYKCMISHLAVDHIETFFREISPYIGDTGIVIGGIGVVGALLGAILVVVGLPISAGIIVALGASAGIWTWILTYGKDAVSDLADEIAIHHDALACAIYEGDGVSDAIDDFNDEVDSLFGAIDAAAIKTVGFEPQLRAMYSGRYKQEDIAQKMDDLGYETVNYICDCEEFEPPPAGYHLVNCGWLSLTSTVQCTDTGSFVNPATGVVTLDYNATGTSWEHTVALRKSEFGQGWLVDGWVIDIVSYNHSLPATPSYRGVSGSFPSPVKINDHIFPGDSWAGFNRFSHSGAAWDDWVDQYDYAYGNNQNPSGSLWDSLFKFGAGSATGAHLLVYRLRILVPDV